MRLACLVVVVLVSNVAHAEERSAVVTIGGAFGGASSVSSMSTDYNYDYDYASPDGAMSGPSDGLGAVRATLAWERPSPAFEMEPGKSNFSGSLVPELAIGSLFEHDRAEGFVGIGLRAELRAAHNSIKPFGLTYKVGGYLVGRALVLGKSQDAAYEFGFGEYFPRFSSFTRIGFEMSVMARPHYMDADETQVIGLFSLFAGWAP
jgi:hypothetical protein